MEASRAYQPTLCKDMRLRLYLLVPAALAVAAGSRAEPPFVTDDPVPLDRGDWEIDIAAIFNRDAGGWSGALPSFEIDYGALPNLELHFEVTNSFLAPVHGSALMDSEMWNSGPSIASFKKPNRFPQVSLRPTCHHSRPGDKQRGLGFGLYGRVSPAVDGEKLRRMDRLRRRRLLVQSWLGEQGLVVLRTRPSKKDYSEPLPWSRNLPRNTKGSAAEVRTHSLARAALSNSASTTNCNFPPVIPCKAGANLEGYLGLEITFGPEHGRK